MTIKNYFNPDSHYFHAGACHGNSNRFPKYGNPNSLVVNLNPFAQFTFMGPSKSTIRWMVQDRWTPQAQNQNWKT